MATLGAVAATGRGTKCAAHLQWTLAPGECRAVRLRFRPIERNNDEFAFYNMTMSGRRAEADEFYDVLQADVRRL